MTRSSTASRSSPLNSGEPHRHLRLLHDQIFLFDFRLAFGKMSNACFNMIARWKSSALTAVTPAKKRPMCTGSPTLEGH